MRAILAKVSGLPGRRTVAHPPYLTDGYGLVTGLASLMVSCFQPPLEHLAALFLLEGAEGLLQRVGLARGVVRG